MEMFICNIKLMFKKSRERERAWSFSLGLLLNFGFIFCVVDELVHVCIMQSTRHWKCKPLKTFRCSKRNCAVATTAVAVVLKVGKKGCWNWKSLRSIAFTKFLGCSSFNGRFFFLFRKIYFHSKCQALECD